MSQEHKKVDKAEAQRDRVEKDLVEFQRYAAHRCVVNMLDAISNTDGAINWAMFAKAAQWAGAHDALRAARDSNDGNKSKFDDGTR